MAILLHDIVMVRDQHGKSQFLRQADLRNSSDSIVTGQEDVYKRQELMRSLRFKKLKS